MPILYPVSLDVLSNPVGTDQVANANSLLVHSTQHSNANDTIEALEAKVGITNSLVTTSHDYKLQNVLGTDKASSVAGTENLTNKTLTALKIVNNGFIADANGNKQIEMVTTASAVNNVRVTNAATTGSPLIDVNGSDSNIDLSLKAKGSGNVKFGTANIKLPNADGSVGDVLTTNGAGVASWGTASNGSDVYLVAGEALTLGDAVMVALGTESSLLNAFSLLNATGENLGNATWIYQSFTTGPNTTNIGKIKLWTAAAGIGGSSYFYTVAIRATPTGSDLATSGILFPDAAPAERETGDFNLTVTASTTYYIIIRGTLGTGSTTLYGGTSSSYSGGVSGVSTNSGVSWTTPATAVTGDFYFKVYERYRVAGNLYKASADSSTYPETSWTTNFIGFNKTAVSALATAGIQVSNIYTGLSGLTTGLIYYLSNTRGAVSSSAGTISKKVGIATSATNLFIRNDN